MYVFIFSRFYCCSSYCKCMTAFLANVCFFHRWVVYLQMRKHSSSCCHCSPISFSLCAHCVVCCVTMLWEGFEKPFSKIVAHRKTSLYFSAVPVNVFVIVVERWEKKKHFNWIFGSYLFTCWVIKINKNLWINNVGYMCVPAFITTYEILFSHYSSQQPPHTTLKPDSWPSRSGHPLLLLPLLLLLGAVLGNSHLSGPLNLVTFFLLKEYEYHSSYFPSQLRLLLN